MKKDYFFYVLNCYDGTFYAGYTTDLTNRITKHNKGLGAKYTRVKSRQPVSLIYFEHFTDKSLVLKREAWFKKLSRREKESFLQERQKNHK